MSDTFRARLDALIERDGINSVADFYGVQRRTIRTWTQGTTPRSAAARRSVVRRARTLTGNAVQTRDAQGRFRTAFAERNFVRAFEVARERRQRAADAIESQARTPAQRAFAAEQRRRAQDVSALVREVEDWRSWREELVEGLRDDWSEWRGTYETIAG